MSIRTRPSWFTNTRDYLSKRNKDQDDRNVFVHVVEFTDGRQFVLHYDTLMHWYSDIAKQFSVEPCFAINVADSTYSTESFHDLLRHAVLSVCQGHVPSTVRVHTVDPVNGMWVHCLVLEINGHRESPVPPTLDKVPTPAELRLAKAPVTQDVNKLLEYVTVQLKQVPELSKIYRDHFGEHVRIKITWPSHGYTLVTLMEVASQLLVKGWICMWDVNTISDNNLYANLYIKE